jgi:HK97 gp10 family phage protein
VSQLVTVELKGVEELRAKMRSVSDNMGGKAMRRSLGKAANVVADKARANLATIDNKDSPNSIPANIAVQYASKSSKSTGDTVFRVGVMGGGKKKENTENTGNPGGATYYWRMVEFGTRKMPSRPFMRPAMEQSIGQVFDTFSDEASKALDRAIKRGAK